MLHTHTSVEVTAQLADVLSVNYTDNTQLPIVNAAVQQASGFERCTHTYVHTFKSKNTAEHEEGRCIATSQGFSLGYSLNEGILPNL